MQRQRQKDSTNRFEVIHFKNVTTKYWTSRNVNFSFVEFMKTLVRIVLEGNNIDPNTHVVEDYNREVVK